MSFGWQSYNDEEESTVASTTWRRVKYDAAQCKVRRPIEIVAKRVLKTINHLYQMLDILSRKCVAGKPAI